jgi:hypothetical protein
VELQNLAWSKPKLRHKSPNVLALIEHFNQVSQQCTTMIVMASGLKQRKAVVEKLLLVAHELLNLNSFNMAMAVKAAFSHSSIYRLKHTFASLSKPTKKVVCSRSSTPSRLMRSVPDGWFVVA